MVRFKSTGFARKQVQLKLSDQDPTPGPLSPGKDGGKRELEPRSTSTAHRGMLLCSQHPAVGGRLFQKPHRLMRRSN